MGLWAVAVAVAAAMALAGCSEGGGGTGPRPSDQFVEDCRLHATSLGVTTNIAPGVENRCMLIFEVGSPAFTSLGLATTCPPGEKVNVPYTQTAEGGAWTVNTAELPNSQNPDCFQP